MRTPTLVIKPGFDPELYEPSGRSYMRDLCQDSWNEVESSNPLIRTLTIENARASIMDDRPEELNRMITEFLATVP